MAGNIHGENNSSFRIALLKGLNKTHEKHLAAVAHSKWSIYTDDDVWNDDWARSPQGYLQFWWLSDALTELRKLLFVVMAYYSERIEINIMKGKGTWGKVQERPGEAFRCLLPVESHREPPTFPSSNVEEEDTWCIASQGRSAEPWCPGVLLGISHIGTGCAQSWP